MPQLREEEVCDVRLRGGGGVNQEAPRCGVPLG